MKERKNLASRLIEGRKGRHHPVVITDTDSMGKDELHINTKKTEAMHFSQGEGTTINGEEMKSVEYLVSYLGERLESYVKNRSACHRLRRTWNSVFLKKHHGAALYGLYIIYIALRNRDVSSH